MDEIQIVGALLTKSVESELGKDLISILVAWLIVRRTVLGHFAAIEGSLRGINESVNDLKDVMTKVENAHSSRLTKLENEVEILQIQKVKKEA